MPNTKMDCAPSEDSDQPGHPPSLIRVVPVRSMGSQEPKLAKNQIFLHAVCKLNRPNAQSGQGCTVCLTVQQFNHFPAEPGCTLPLQTV